MRMMWEGRNPAGRRIAHVGKRRDRSSPDQKSGCVFVRRKVEVWDGGRRRRAPVPAGAASGFVTMSSAAAALIRRAGEGREGMFWHLLWAEEPRL